MRKRLPEGHGSRFPSYSASTPRLIDRAFGALELLGARGFPLAPEVLCSAYARLLSRQALKLDAAGEPRHPELSPARPQTGYHARDPSGVRYWIVGRRRSEQSAPVVVPGIPDRAFDRILLVRFDSGFGVSFAGSARATPFLKEAEYREPTNEWALDADAPFWKGDEVKDLTVLFRITAGQAAGAEEPEEPRASRRTHSTVASTTRPMNS